MKKSNILILAVTAIFMFPNPTHSQNGPDPVRAGMFKLYAKTATKALVAQDAVLTVNISCPRKKWTRLIIFKTSSTNI